MLCRHVQTGSTIAKNTVNEKYLAALAKLLKNRDNPQFLRLINHKQRLIMREK